MTKQKGPDKNLQNVAKDLELEPVNAHNANQLQRQSEDRRHQDNLNHEDETDLDHPLT
ncbi:MULTISPECIES: hypothetical protein [unclassified Paenibacillus]|uniref:hypothetical protein n=1 Tax=unclassified Paenibacillus TaxID=185978 RepID=UPI00095684E2|nr:MULTISPECIES: hypothetical protein [unclassified Paenibacillus]SIR61783.1 hypothetical protein SAMN05880555_4474 [Paenibacillus sp. RU4X]SIR70384.1 hypothetical protein SAMN05880570_4476 [Paenibacillus sp. RU4T]